MNDNLNYWHAIREAFFNEKKNFPYDYLKQITPYLYETQYSDLDYDYATDFFEKDSPVIAGCSAIRKGNLYGRNYDWLYNDNVEFVVHVPATNTRHASVGVSSNIPIFTKSFVESGAYTSTYKIIPFRIVDGINDDGVVINVNVAPCDGIYGTTTGTNPGKPRLCASMLIRFVLDNLNSSDLVNLKTILDEYDIYVPQSLISKEFELHFMVANSEKTYSIEFINNSVKVTELSAPYLTNFYLEGVTFNNDGTVYTQKDITSSISPSITNGITPHGSGLERYNYLVNHSSDDIYTVLQALKFTNSYQNINDYNSDFVGVYENINITVDTPYNDETFMLVKQQIIDAYEHRNRKTGLTWQTVHTSVYNIGEQTLNINCQEDYQNQYTFKIQ